MDEKVSLDKKFCLTIDEAALYFGIGQKKLREMSAGDDCPYVLWVGSKRLIKREACEKYLNAQFSV